MSKWVQHISGQGEKWEIVKEWNDGVSVRNVKDGFIYHVPLSEYVECSPPEEWIDVTEDFGSSDLHVTGLIDCDKHRLRKVGVEWFSGVPLKEAKRGVAFIVERRKV